MRRREERTVKNAAGKSTAKVAEVNGAEETVNPLDFYGQPDRKISVFFYDFPQQTTKAAVGKFICP